MRPDKWHFHVPWTNQAKGLLWSMGQTQFTICFCMVKIVFTFFISLEEKKKIKIFHDM